MQFILASAGIVYALHTLRKQDWDRLEAIAKAIKADHGCRDQDEPSIGFHVMFPANDNAAVAQKAGTG